MPRYNPVTNIEYFNKFNPSKLYQEILFNGGVNLQQRELNEIIALLGHRVSRLGNTLYNDGSIVGGGGIIIDINTVTIPQTEVFIAGVVYTLESSTVTITTEGIEVIGVKLVEEIVNYDTDAELLDPMPGSNFGRPGADRLKITPSWVINDSSAYPIWTLENGQLKVEKFAPESDAIAAWLARRTNDESGSYTVSGLTGYVIEKDEDNLSLVVEAGTAYVLGWEIKKPSPINVDFPKAKSFSTIVNEAKTYTTGTNDYLLNSQPVKEIHQVTGQVSATISMTRGETANGMDLIPELYHPISSITSINGYSSPSSYLLNGNYVDWSPGGSEPSSGSNYQITFVYTKVMESEEDYTFYKNDNNKGYVRFLSGDKPVNGSNFTVSYDYYLSRHDLFYLTKDGEIKVMLGRSGNTPVIPPLPIGVLVLGDMVIPADSIDIVVNNYDPKRLTMAEINYLKKRIDEVQYNLALEDLDNAAADMDPATTKKGIFTDGFINMNKMDLEYTNFGCSIDIENNTLMSEFISTEQNLVPNTTGTARIHNRYATKDYTEIVGAQQLYATQMMNVNPYMVYGNVATISVSPNQDNWVELEVITRHVFRWWDIFISHGTRAGTYLGAVTRNSSIAEIVVDEAILYMRQRILVIKGSNFIPNSDNIKCKMDGKLVQLTIGSKGSAGSQPGTVKANGNGEFEATFTIPQNIKTGTREIYVWNEV